MIYHIDHINISVTDLDSATNFFVQNLGFKVTQEGPLEGPWVDKVVGLSNVKAHFVKLTLPNSQTNLELIKYENPAGSTDPQLGQPNQIGIRHFAFNVTDIESHYETLKLNGVKIFSEIQVYNETKKLFYFHGPDDVILELCEYSK